MSMGGSLLVFLLAVCFSVGPVTVEGYDIEGKSLNEICKHFNITKGNCSCTGSDEFIIYVCKKLNGTKSTEKIFLEKINYTKAVCNLLAAIFALIGNGLVIGLTVKDWQSFPRFRRLITGLASSDFVYGFFLLIYNIPELWRRQWAYGGALCIILTPCLHASMNIAVGFMVIIAVDRFIGIVYSFNRVLSEKRVWILVAINICLGVASVVPQANSLGLDEFSLCTEFTHSYTSGYTWLLFIFYYVIPVVALVTLYTSMTVWLQRSFFRNKILNDAQQKVRLKSNRNIIIMLVSILACFALLVLPNKIFWIIKDENKFRNSTRQEYDVLLTASEIAYSLHAVVNPIIYTFIDKKFRQQLTALFRCRKQDDSSLSPRTSAGYLRSSAASVTRMNSMTSQIE